MHDFRGANESGLTSRDRADILAVARDDPHGGKVFASFHLTKDEENKDRDCGWRIRWANCRNLFRQTALQKDPAIRRQLLTFVIAGAGFSGVETAGGYQRFRTRSRSVLSRSEREVGSGRCSPSRANLCCRN